MRTGGGQAAGGVQVEHLFVSAHEDGGYATWKVSTGALHAAPPAADETLALSKPVEPAKVPYGMRYPHLLCSSTSTSTSGSLERSLLERSLPTLQRLSF